MKYALLIVIFLYLPLSAQWSTNPEQNLQISNFGYFVDACEDGHGGAFVCWRTTADNPTVWVQWVDRLGHIRWPQPIQITGAGLGQTDNKIIKTSDNAAIIAFGDQYVGDTFDVPPYVIYKTYIALNKIDTSGTLLWGDEGVRATVDTAQQQDLVIVPDENGGAYLTWNDRFPVWSDPDSMIIRLQHITHEGQRVWGDSGRYVYKAPQNYYVKPYINNRLPDGLFLRYPRKDIGLTLESINSNGVKEWKKVNDWYGKPLPLNDGGGLWATKYVDKIIANRMDNAGNLVWSDSGLVVEPILSEYSGLSDYTLIDDGSLVLSYLKDWRIPNYNSYVQIIDKDGQLYFQDSSKIYTKSDGSVATHSIISSNSNSFIITWKDTRTSNPGYYCQKFTKNLNKLWDTTDVIFSNRLHENNKYLSDNNYGFIKIWDEFASLEFGTYAQQVSKDGELGVVITGIENTPEKRPDRFKLFQNYPNPFNNSTIISFLLSEQKHINISVYNTMGQKVNELFNGIKHSGYHQLIWNGTDRNDQPVSSGVYYIKLESDNNQQIIKTVLIK